MSPPDPRRQIALAVLAAADPRVLIRVDNGWRALSIHPTTGEVVVETVHVDPAPDPSADRRAPSPEDRSLAEAVLELFIDSRLFDALAALVRAG